MPTDASSCVESRLLASAWLVSHQRSSGAEVLIVARHTLLKVTYWRSCTTELLEFSRLNYFPISAHGHLGKLGVARYICFLGLTTEVMSDIIVNEINGVLYDVCEKECCTGIL